MPTIINNPPATETDNEQSSYTGIILVVITILFLFLIFYYGLPYLRRASAPSQINIPDKVDVNVNTNK